MARPAYHGQPVARLVLLDLAVDSPTGYALGLLDEDAPAGFKLLEWGVWGPSTSALNTGMLLSECLHGLNELTEMHGPLAVCVEDVYRGPNATTQTVLASLQGIVSYITVQELGALWLEPVPAPTMYAAVGVKQGDKDGLVGAARMLAMSMDCEPEDIGEHSADAICQLYAVVQREHQLVLTQEFYEQDGFL